MLFIAALLQVFVIYSWTMRHLITGASLKVTLVVAFTFLPQNFGELAEPTNNILSVCVTLEP